MPILRWRPRVCGVALALGSLANCGAEPSAEGRSDSGVASQIDPQPFITIGELEGAPQFQFERVPIRTAPTR